MGEQYARKRRTVQQMQIVIAKTVVVSSYSDKSLKDQDPRVCDSCGI